jgi:monoamine oxidase
VCIVGGRPCADLFKDGNTDEFIVLAALQSLREVFGQDTIPEDPSAALALLDGSIVTRWGSDPFSCGSFSHMCIGSLPADYENMAKGYWNDRLFFAGEGTIKTYPGTTHGAFFSGERAASMAISSCLMREL